jgi:hypothetical protein
MLNRVRIHLSFQRRPFGGRQDRAVVGSAHIAGAADRLALLGRPPHAGMRFDFAVFDAHVSSVKLS